MISEKMKSHLAEEGVIRKMFETGLRMKAEFGAENVFDFSLGNPNVPAPEKVKKSIEKILDTLPSGKIHSYMPNAGYPEVRVEVAKHLNRRFGTSYSEKNIVMTAGAGSALNLLMKSMLDIDDEVVCFCPYFAEYKGYIENYYGKVVEAPAKDDGSLMPDLDAFSDAVTDRTRAVIIDSPNNPTGTVYPESVISGIAEVLRKKEKEYGRPIYLISDEPYRDICFDASGVWDLPEGESKRYQSAETLHPEEGQAAPDLPWVPYYYDDAVVAYSYSKSLSLPGERIGNIIIPDSCDGAAELIGAVTTANLVTGVVNAPSLMQRVIARCVDEAVDLDFYRTNAALLYEAVTSAGFEAVKPRGAFYLWIKAPGGDNAFTDAAREEKILVVPGSAFSGPGYVRASFCVARDVIERSRDAWKALAAKCLG